MTPTQKVSRDRAIERLQWCRKQAKEYLSLPKDYIEQNKDLHSVGLFDLIGEEVFILSDLELAVFQEVLDVERNDLPSVF